MKYLPFLFLLVPLFAQAQTKGVPFKDFVNLLIGGVNTIVIPLLFSFAFLFFLWGVFKYFILSGDSEKGREDGRNFILWGLVAIAVMLSTWGLVRIFMNTFGL